MKRSRSTLALLVLSLSWSLAACSQDEGESCQLEGDCSSGLICCKGAADRGYCSTKDECENAPLDSGVPDASKPDANDDDSGAAQDSGPMSIDSSVDSGMMSLDDAGDSDAG